MLNSVKLKFQQAAQSQPVSSNISNGLRANSTAHDNFIRSAKNNISFNATPTNETLKCFTDKIYPRLDKLEELIEHYQISDEKMIRSVEKIYEHCFRISDEARDEAGKHFDDYNNFLLTTMSNTIKANHPIDPIELKHNEFVRGVDDKCLFDQGVTGFTDKISGVLDEFGEMINTTKISRAFDSFGDMINTDKIFNKDVIGFVATIYEHTLLLREEAGVSPENLADDYTKGCNFLTSVINKLAKMDKTETKIAELKTTKAEFEAKKVKFEASK